MVFSIREAIGGFKHIGLGWTRTFAKRPESFFLSNYSARSVLVERFAARDGRDAICPICGYAMIRVELPNGWLFETCSAMPTITGLDSADFNKWAESLEPAKLPTARV